MSTPESERLERRAQALNVTVRSLNRCKHVESLIYFDKIYGVQCSWQVCDYCEQEFNMTQLEPTKGLHPGTLEETRHGTL